MKGKSLKKRLSFVLAIMMVAAFVPTNMFVNAANSKALKKKNSVTSKKINLKRNALENSYAIKTLRINCDSFDKFLEGTPEEELVKVDKLFVGSMEFRKTSSKISAWGDAFYVDELSKRIYIGRALRADEVVTLKGEGRVLGKFKALVSGTHDLEVVQEGGDAKAFKVRLKGYFEPGVEGQKKYDSISGATGTVVQSQNSHVNVEVAYGENPKESDWKPIKETGLKPTKDSKVIIKNAKNITGRYNTFDGSINIEVAKEGLVQGDYPVSIEVHDGSGRVETSNEVIFRVYSNKTTLKEVCTEEKMEKETGGFKKLQGGDIYQWTQEPWQITDIGGDETFTVPKKLKLWYGSHESGLYGFLGRVIPEDKEQEQTLIVEKGTNLHIINMKILSGVKIVVKDGGMLSFDDSSLFGKIVVEKGGKFQMNYDAKNKKFTQGSSINGQLVLKDGAIINSSSIYSNANSVTDSNVARRIDWPVVKVEGKVTVEGKVYIRGDEAATGKTPEGKPYEGQPALGLESGATLDITQGSEVGCYGAGKFAYTSIAADAVKMRKGSRVTGKGKLIAVGGSVIIGSKAGHAVAGEGDLDVAEVFLKGGNIYKTDGKFGLPITAKVVIDANTRGKVAPGKALATHSDNDQPAYWGAIAAPGTDPHHNPLQHSDTTGAPKLGDDKSHLSAKILSAEYALREQNEGYTNEQIELIKKVVGEAKAVEADNEALKKEFARSIESLTAVLLGKGDPNSKIKIKLRVPKVIKLNLKAKIFTFEVKVGGIEKDRLKGLTMYVVQQGRLKKKLDPGEIYRKGRLYVPLTSKEMKALRNGKLSIFIYNKGNVKGDHVTSKVKKK